MIMENNLEFVRIDDRLIHGQVVAAWLHAYSDIKHILVVDDKVSRDSFMQEMFALLVPTGISIKIEGIEDSIATVKAGLEKPTMIIVKEPQTIKSLVDGGMDISYLNIGGMGMSAGRKKLYKNISMSEEEKRVLRELIDRGMHIDIQIIPAYNKVDLSTLI